MPTDGSAQTIEVDAYHASTRAALTLHGGRAWTNHEAIMAILRMAAADDVGIALVGAPERYKGTPAAAPIFSFVERLSGWRGVRLDLEAVVVFSY